MKKDYSKNPAYKKPIFEDQPALLLIQGCYFQKQPEMFLNLTDKKLFDTQYFISRFKLFYFTTTRSCI